MKWVKTPVKDGAYITYTFETESMGMLVRSKGKWFGRIPSGLVPVPDVSGIDRFCKLVRPKE